MTRVSLASLQSTSSHDARLREDILVNPTTVDLGSYQTFLRKVKSPLALAFSFSIYIGLVTALSALPWAIFLIVEGLATQDQRNSSLYISLYHIGFPLFCLLFFVALFIGAVFHPHRFNVPRGYPERKYMDEDTPKSIATRKATKREDKVFGTYFIVERLVQHELSPPNCSKPVGTLYMDLCIQLFPLYGISLLTMAAMKSFTG